MSAVQSWLIVLSILAVPLITSSLVSLYHPQVEREALISIEEVARLKAAQIENWLHERSGDAEALLADEFLALDVSEILGAGPAAILKRRQIYFDRLRAAYDYAGVCLVGLDGKLFLSSGDCVQHLSDSERNLRELKSGAIARSPLYLQTQDEIHLDWVIPIGAADRGGRPLAALILRASANRFLFPHIKAWPTASASGESLLVRRQGSDVVFLNELRFREHTALSLRLPLTNPLLPAAAAVLANASGTTIGVDYRGVAVVAAYRPVAGTDWVLVAKVDRAEVLASLDQMARWIALVSFVGTLVAALAVGKYWQTRQRVASLLDAAKDAKAELERQRSTQQFASLFNLSPIAGIISLVEDGRFMQINENFKRDFGWSEDEVIGLTSVETRLWPDVATRDCFIEAFGHEERLTGYETIMMTRDGRSLNVSLSSAIIEMNNQRCLLTFAIDITERRAAQMQLLATEVSLKESLTQTLLLLDAMMDAVICMDQNGLVTTWNTHAEAMFGYLAKEAIGRRVEELIVPPAYRERHRQGMARFVKTSQSRIIGQRLELPAMRADGTEFPIELTLGSIGSAGQFLFSAAARDITERKRLVEELVQYREHLEQLVEQRTEELNAALKRADTATQAKSAFLANMSHEIRTPMNAIVGLTHVLRRSTLATEQRQLLDKVTGAADHLQSIIDNILDLTKIESGKIQLEQIDFDLGALFENVRSMLLDAAQKKGLEIKVDYTGVPPWLRGDPTRLRQSLLNYVSNAIKFTRTGFVIMRARMLAETDAGIRIQFEVEDSGPGISTESQARLFGAFEQADTSTTRKYGGTGLGLAITRRLASLMGGDAGVRSQLGQGSTFWFTVVLQHGQGVAVRGMDECDAEAKLRSFAGTRILLVDDVEVNRQLCIALLDATGLIVDTAEDGREALSKASATDYAAILMDVQMPVMDGLEATRAILELPDRKRTAIIAMTANAFVEDRRLCEQAGMVYFLTKPVDPEQLFRSLAVCLSKAAALASPLPEAISAVPAAPLSAALPSSATGDDALPGLDLARGLTIWDGKVELYKKFLGKFANTYPDVAQTLRRLAASNDGAAAGALAHKLKGAAANMPLPEVARLAGEVERALKGGAGEMAANALTSEVPGLLLQLDQALATALNSIACYAPPPRAAQAAVISAEPDMAQRTLLAALLQSLLNALDTDDPARAEPVLEQLSSRLAAPQLQSVRAALDNFDFRGAETATRQLTADLML